MEEAQAIKSEQDVEVEYIQVRHLDLEENNHKPKQFCVEIFCTRVQ